MRIIVLITAVTALLASCASFKAGVKESDPLVVCEHINKGDSDTLSEVSVLPFVFDTEILESDSQIRSPLVRNHRGRLQGEGPQGQGVPCCDSRRRLPLLRFLGDQDLLQEPDS